MKIRTLDLFSGIGGFSLAMTSVCKTVAYSEIDPRCVDCLKKNIMLGRLDNAPIFGDVTAIPLGALRKLRPEMITGGFPCQDISSLNASGAGVLGPKSKLVFEITRLVKFLPSVKCVLMENSPFIKYRGMDLVLKEFVDIGWDVSWSYFTATEVGALHSRKRWVMLAMAPGTTIPIATHVFKPKYTEPTKVILQDSKSKLRGGMLGNAVVPAMITHAYNVLRDIKAYSANSGPECGYVGVGGKKLFKRKIKHDDVDLRLHISQGQVSFLRKLWSTPIKAPTGWSISSKLIPTSLQKFPNQVVYEQGTQASMRALIPNFKSAKEFSINPEWVEWLMMYPKGWTK